MDGGFALLNPAYPINGVVACLGRFAGVKLMRQSIFVQPASFQQVPDIARRCLVRYAILHKIKPRKLPHGVAVHKWHFRVGIEPVADAFAKELQVNGRSPTPSRRMIRLD